MPRCGVLQTFTRSLWALLLPACQDQDQQEEEEEWQRCPGNEEAAAPNVFQYFLLLVSGWPLLHLQLYGGWGTGDSESAESRGSPTAQGCGLGRNQEGGSHSKVTELATSFLELPEKQAEVGGSRVWERKSENERSSFLSSVLRTPGPKFSNTERMTLQTNGRNKQGFNTQLTLSFQ